MIQPIVNAFIIKREDWGSCRSLVSSSNYEKAKARFGELTTQYLENSLAVYDLPLNTDLNTLVHYRSVWIGKEEFEWMIKLKK